MVKIMDELMLREVHVMVNGHFYNVCKFKDGSFAYHGVPYVDENLMLNNGGEFINEDKAAIEKILEVL